MVIILISLFLAILLEADITTLPLVLLIILFASVVIKKNEMFALAFFSGLILDIMSFGRIGLSSLYFTLFVFIIFLYQKKFEIETLHFVAIFSFFGSLGYLWIEGVSYFFLQSLFATIIVISSFIAYKSFNKKAPKYA